MLLALLMGGLGLIVGSFLGLVSLRLPRGEDILVSRSRCGGCGRPLKPWRMIPVVSWALSRGKCSDCGAAFKGASLNSHWRKARWKRASRSRANLR